jgi:DNA modification methylase
VLETALKEYWSGRLPPKLKQESKDDAGAPVNLLKTKPYYVTKWGAAYLGDSFKLLKEIPDQKIDLILTSPPYPLVRQKPYKHEFDFVEASKYVKWFSPFAREIHRILRPRGSLVLNLGSSWNLGVPTKSLYYFELLIDLCKNKGFSLAQDFYWYNTAKFPSPAEWTNIKRVRAKDAVDPIWWLSKDPKGRTTSKNTRVLTRYSDSMRKLLRDKKYDAGRRPSGYVVSPTSFLRRHRGAIPPNLLKIPHSDDSQEDQEEVPTNLLQMPNTASNGSYMANCKAYGFEVNPARFPVGLPQFFIRFLTSRKTHIILDPFSGSNTTGFAAESLGRRWIAMEISEEYIQGSRFRFFTPEKLGLPPMKEDSS